MDYNYVAYSKDRKLTRGRVSAVSEKVANQTLEKQGYRLLTLKPAMSRLPSWRKWLPSLSKVPTSEVVTFSRQLALLIQSGVSITRGLDLMANQTSNKNMKSVLEQIVSDIRSGSTLSAAFAKHPGTFPVIYANLIAVGERTGGLDGTLRQLADYLERQQAAANKIKMAMVYPCLVLGLAVVVVAVLMLVALPPLVGMFKGFGTRLPLTTRLLIGMVELVMNYGIFMFSGILVLAVATGLYSRTKAGRYRWNRLIITVPLIGRLILLSELGRACRCMSLLFRAGVPVHEVLALTSQSTGNAVVRQGLEEVTRAAIRGEGLSRPMSRNGVFLPLMVEMTKVGEETGNPDETLKTVAETYEVDSDDKTRRLIGLIEPAMTIAVGVLVGFIALSIFMPIYGMLGSLK